MKLETALYFETLKRRVATCESKEELRKIAIAAIELYLQQQAAITYMAKTFGSLGEV